jgi:hypothetical protein
MRTTILTVIITALLAIPAFAQEEGGGGDGAAGVGAGQTQVFTALITPINGSSERFLAR